MTLVSASSIRLPAGIQEFSSSVEYRNNRFIFKKVQYATLHKKDGCYFSLIVTILVAGWS
ncbi:hypothetical protein QMA02_27595 [Bacillus wiedmannii]|uniref:hypothetical protein n=1 Tax=Bacillus wiedmannii TaxID=1890302 RepID=UPI000305B4E6|nr:hypothetical protein [Bacillus wiedmannii]MDI6679562.1 hypothetical protein [Bacillus wiedmannii]HDR7640477.1 hypothetical protein [Bacillus wiedmannii]